MLLNILLTVLTVVCVALTGVILLQRSEGGALGMGGGSNFMSARGTGDLLTRTTQVLAVLFFLLSLAITIVTGRQEGASSVVDQVGVGSVDPAQLQARMKQAQQQKALEDAQKAAGGEAPSDFGAPTPQIRPAGEPAAPAEPAPAQGFDPFRNFPTNK